MNSKLTIEWRRSILAGLIVAGLMALLFFRFAELSSSVFSMNLIGFTLLARTLLAVLKSQKRIFYYLMVIPAGWLAITLQVFSFKLDEVVGLSDVFDLLQLGLLGVVAFWLPTSVSLVLFFGGDLWLTKRPSKVGES